MADLLARVAHQQALLDAWDQVRDSARRDGKLDAPFVAFEHRAAARLTEMSEELLAGAWRPSPVHPVEIPKPTGGTRRLGVPLLEDRIVERAILQVLDPIVDPELQPWSFAYRRGLGVHDAHRSLLEARDDGATWVARGDFTDCFDAIPRARVLERLNMVVPDPKLRELIRLLVYRPIRGAGSSSPLGLHQGSGISPLLTNLYLDRFDRAMLASGWQVIRYGDDFAVPVPDRQAGHDALRDAQQHAATLGLQLSPEKCAVRSFDEGVPFLGATLTAGTGTRTERSSHPTATTVYVAEEEDGLLRRRGSRLRLERDGELVFSLAFPRVRQIVVFGRVGMTTPFLHQVLTRGIDLVLLSDTGTFVGRVQGATAANPFVREGQYEAARVQARWRDIARRIVRGKIVNLRVGLLRGRRREGASRLQEVIDRMERNRSSVDKACTTTELMGVEGAASRDYFSGLAELVDRSWGFNARRRRPPPDPFNSLLSLGYTLLLHEAIAAVEVAALDPYVGFLHRAKVGRPSLALDLIEEFRPVLVDSVALRAVNTRMLRPEHFTTDEGPPRRCLLTRDGRKLFLGAYERRMLTLVTHPAAGRRVPYRVALGLQARSLADEVIGRGRYEPMVWK